MSSTNFVNGTTIEADWLNDVDAFVYGTAGKPLPAHRYMVRQGTAALRAAVDTSQSNQLAHIEGFTGVCGSASASVQIVNNTNGLVWLLASNTTGSMETVLMGTGRLAARFILEFGYDVDIPAGGIFSTQFGLNSNSPGVDSCAIKVSQANANFQFFTGSSSGTTETTTDTGIAFDGTTNFWRIVADSTSTRLYHKSTVGGTFTLVATNPVLNNGSSYTDRDYGISLARTTGSNPHIVYAALHGTIYFEELA